MLCYCNPHRVKVAEEQREAEQTEGDGGEEEGEADQEGHGAPRVPLIEPERGHHQVEEADRGGQTLEAVVIEVTMEVGHVDHFVPDGGPEQGNQGHQHQGERGDQGLDKGRRPRSLTESAVVLTLKLPVEDKMSQDESC